MRVCVPHGGAVAAFSPCLVVCFKLVRICTHMDHTINWLLGALCSAELCFLQLRVFVGCHDGR
jgi:hypothetical protein